MPTDAIHERSSARRRSLLSAVALLVLAGAVLTQPAAAGPVRGNFEISGPECRFPDVAHGGAGGRYLVVWADYSVTRIFGRFVSGAGEVTDNHFGVIFLKE